MTPDTRDWGALVRALRRQPTSSVDAVDRIMAELTAPAPSRTIVRPSRRWMQVVVLGVAAALVFALVVPAAPERRMLSRIVTAISGHHTVRFQLVDRTAREVCVAGDFNDWNPRATVLRRTSADGLWSVELRLAPGRHTYAFVIDGQRWVPDESAPRAPDGELGTPSSVVLVGVGS
jgi:hypothetical protein